METGWLLDNTTVEDWLLGMGQTQRVAMVAAGPNALDDYMAEEDYMGTYNRCVLTQSPFCFLYFFNSPSFDHYTQGRPPKTLRHAVGHLG